MRGAFHGHAVRGSEEAGGGDGDRKLEPIQQRYREIVAEPGYLDSVLKAGAEAVTPIANSTVELVKQRMGIYVPR